MTKDEYVGRSNALQVEMKRIADIMQSAAEAKERYGVLPNPGLLAKVHSDLDNVIGRVKALDQAFWAAP